MVGVGETHSWQSGRRGGRGKTRDGVRGPGRGRSRRRLLLARAGAGLGRPRWRVFPR